LDFVLEMAAIDDPDQWSFKRADDDSQPRSETLAGWGDRLSGRAFQWFLGRTGIAAANAGLAAWNRRRGSTGLRPGLTQGGKRIEPDVGHGRKD
jgi:hypothetical protein